MQMSADLDARSKALAAKLALRLSTASARFPVVQRAVLSVAAEALKEPMLQIVREETPRGSGNLEEHEQAQLGIAPDGDVHLTVTAPGVPYLQDVIKGTGVYRGRQAYTILPRNKKALYWKGAGHPVGGVTIQGIKPNPFPARARVRLVPIVMAGMRPAARKIGRSMLGSDEL